MKALNILCWLLLTLLPVGVRAQCFGTVQFPVTTVVPSVSISPTLISGVSFAGDYAVVSLTAGGIYRFSSSVLTDHITVSTAVASGVLTFGTQPVLYTAAATQNYFVHFHTNAGCGTEEVNRITQVQRVYCAAGTNSCGGTNESISRVRIGAIDNVSNGCGGGGYSDFSSQLASVVTGQPMPITVVNSAPFAGDEVRVFVDWDRNFNLADAGEVTVLSTTDNITFTGAITAPPGATPGLVRMRVRIAFGAMGSCGNTNFGEVEDYTLNVGSFGNGVFAGGDGRGDVQLAFTNGIGGSQFMGGDGRGDVALSFTVTLPSQIYVSLKGMLEGPYSSTTGLMGDALRTLPSFPLTEPYTVLGYAHTGGGGGETVAPAVLAVTGNNAIVDWVVVELRDIAVPATVVASRSALVQRDGDVVAVDGVSPVSFNLASGSYNVALRHRNHLGAMTTSSVALSSSSTAVDLSSAGTSTFGTSARKTITGTFPTQALWAGDVTFNGQVKYTGSGNDRDPILTTVGSTTPNNTVSIYSTRDVNLNGQVKYTGSANDRDPILVNVGSTTPNNIRQAQLP